MHYMLHGCNIESATVQPLIALSGEETPRDNYNCGSTGKWLDVLSGSVKHSTKERIIRSLGDQECAMPQE